MTEDAGRFPGLPFSTSFVAVAVVTIAVAVVAVDGEELQGETGTVGTGYLDPLQFVVQQPRSVEQKP